MTPVSVLTKSLALTRIPIPALTTRIDRVVEIVRLRLSLEIARVAWISNHLQIRGMLRSIRHMIRVLAHQYREPLNSRWR
jgi:hypothetical protein